jgi:alpha-L-rhamnosidase
VQYILKGEGEEIYEPHFTFQGFRYVKVEDYPGELRVDDLTGIVIHSDFELTGSFSCSNPLLNRLQHNIQWGQKGNFLDVPTDCPQRDERLGWTGDAQVFSRAACFNGDVAAFFTKWLADLSADQFEDGRVPHVVPNVLGPNSGGSAGWADASTIIPWNVYLIYGDKRILENQYKSMVKWVNYMENEAGEDYLWNTGPHFGDWLFYSINNDVSGRSAVTNKYLIAQAFFAHSTELLLKIAKLFGKTEDERKYGDLLRNVKQAFLNEYVTPNGNLVSGTQTAYVLALKFDLLPEEQQKGAIEKLVKSIKEYKDHLTTGFLGTPYICHVLSDHGYPDIAYKLLLQETYPSWLYPVKMGATTIWERWDGIRTDGSFEEASMNSFNHYAYGAIGDWMYRVIGGINPDEEQSGYKHIIIHPRPGGNLEYAKTSYQSGYGEIRTSWNIEGDIFRLRVVIPVNTTASVILPQGGKPENIRESGKPLNEVQGILSSKPDVEDVLLELGSGDYDFTYTLKD